MAGGFFTTEPQGKAKNTGVGSLSILQGNLPNPGIKPGSPALQGDSLPTTEHKNFNGLIKTLTREPTPGFL